MQNVRYVLVMLIALAALSLNCSLSRPTLDLLSAEQPATTNVEQKEQTPAVVLFSTATSTIVPPASVGTRITSITVQAEPSTEEPLSASSTPIDTPVLGDISTPTNTPVPTKTSTPTNALPVSTNIPAQISPTTTPVNTFLENSDPTLTPTVVPSPTAADTRNSKRGIMLPAAYSFCQDIEALNANWYYRNGTSPAPDCPSPDPRFVPRLSNAKKVTDETLTAAIENARASGWLIGYTEPNLPWWDGYVTPREGALAWRKIEEAVLPAGIKLVSPSPSQHSPGQNDDYGYTWIWAMVEAYEDEYGKKPHFDAMGWNIYENRVEEAQSFLNTRHQEALEKGYDVPFWVLEYAGECWNTDRYPTGNNEIMTVMTGTFEKTPWIDRYVWFTNRIKSEDPWAPNWHSCSLIDPETGNLTDLGKLYATY